MGYLLTVACPCGVVFERWVTSVEADADLGSWARLEAGRNPDSQEHLASQSVIHMSASKFFKAQLQSRCFHFTRVQDREKCSGAAAGRFGGWRGAMTSRRLQGLVPRCPSGAGATHHA